MKNSLEMMIGLWKKLMVKRRRITALREALTEIRDIAAISEGVEFYAMLANKALEEDDKRNEEHRS